VQEWKDLVAKDVKVHSHIHEAMPRGGRECKRVQQSRNWSSEASHRCAASLAMLCNTFIVEAYTHRRNEAARNPIVFLHTRAILASESQSLQSTF